MCVLAFFPVQKRENISSGDTVRICNNLDELKALQVGHGGWDDAMKDVSRVLISFFLNYVLSMVESTEG